MTNVNGSWTVNSELTQPLRSFDSSFEILKLPDCADMYGGLAAWLRKICNSLGNQSMKYLL